MSDSILRARHRPLESAPARAPKPSPRRSRAAKAALADEPHAAAFTLALSRQAKAAARRRPANARKVAAKGR